MKFEEENYTDVTKIPSVFIYFLLMDDEVVYVGQTKNGTSRIQAHKYNKDFNKVYVIECCEEDLDYLENEFILKYDPKYNKIPNTRAMIRVDKLAHKLNIEVSPKTRFSINKVSKILDELKINPKYVYHIPYIYDWEYDIILSAFRDYENGAPLDEVFNIRV